MDAFDHCQDKPVIFRQCHFVYTLGFLYLSLWTKPFFHFHQVEWRKGKFEFSSVATPHCLAQSWHSLFSGDSKIYSCHLLQMQLSRSQKQAFASCKLFQKYSLVCCVYVGTEHLCLILWWVFLKIYELLPHHILLHCRTSHTYMVWCHMRFMLTASDLSPRRPAPLGSCLATSFSKLICVGS